MNDRKNFIWNFLGLTINAFNSLFFLIIVNRVNGTSDAGIFTFAFSLISLIFYIALYYTRPFQISNGDITNREFIVHRIINCIIMVISVVLLCILFRYDFYKFSIIFLIGLYRMLEALADVFYGIEQSVGELYKSGISLFFKGIIGVVLFYLVDVLTNDVRMSCLALVVVNLIGIIFYDILNSKKYITKKFNKKNLTYIYKKAFPIFIFSFLNIYLVNATKYTLDFYDSPEIQNVFGIILMPGTVLSLCCQYILNPFLVRFNEYKKNKKYHDFNKLVIRIVLLIVILGVLAELFLYLFGIPILNFIYNISLDDYKFMLLIILIGSTIYALVSIFSSILTVLGKNAGQMYIYIICSIIAFLISMLSINSYGILGASIGYSLIMFILLSMYIIYYINVLKKSIRDVKNED